MQNAVTPAALKRLLNYEDFRRVAALRLPRGLFEFIDRGTEDEVALLHNRRSLTDIKLVPRVLRDVSGVKTQSALFGRACEAPILVAPTGAAGLACHKGELALAKAAAHEGVPFVMSTASLTAMEEIAMQAGGDLWLQLYVWQDRKSTYELIERAWRNKFEKLVVTVDTAVSPNREYNVRNGFTIPMRLTARNVWDVAMRPRWATGVMLRYLLTNGLPKHANYPEHLRKSLVSKPAAPSPRASAKTFCWDEVKELRDRWQGKLLLKGVLHPEDAELARATGIDGLVISNHGGRNLDSCVSPVAQLPVIRRAVGQEMLLLADSGMQRGSDALKAIALGANGVLFGRFPLWGAAVAGEAGARHALRIIKHEMLRTLSLSGITSIDDVTDEVLA